MNLAKGKNYALYGWSDPFPLTMLRTSGGKPLARFTLWDLDEAEGASFRAPYTGRYVVTVTAGEPCGTNGQGNCTRAFPAHYTLSAARDCSGGPSTPCGIAVGQTIRNLNLSFIGDPKLH